MSFQDKYPIGTVLEFLEKDCDVNKGDEAVVVGYKTNGLILDFGRPVRTNAISGWFPELHNWKVVDKLRQTTQTQISLTPKNNDGRTTCFACGGATRKAGGGAYDICTKCGR